MTSSSEQHVERAVPTSSLGDRARSGTIWLVAGFGLGQCLRLFANVVLAALLFEEVFALMAIVTAVQAAGVRTGESWGWLHRRLEDRAYDTPAAPEPILAASWRARLGLGNIWD